MRRLRLALTLPLLALLLLAQQGATLHELTHLYYSGQARDAQLRAGDHLLDDAHCLTCQSFAQVSHPASGSAIVFVAPPAALPQSPAPLYSVIGASAPTPRSRGPPHIAL